MRLVWPERRGGGAAANPERSARRAAPCRPPSPTSLARAAEPARAERRAQGWRWGLIAGLRLKYQERVRKYWTITVAIAPPKVQAAKGHALVPSVTRLNQCWAFIAAT